MSERVAFYRCDSNVDPVALPDGYSLKLWKPGFTPQGGGKMTVVLWLFHVLRVFANRDYSAVQIYHGETLSHTSYVFPRFFRFPFMSQTDLQVGDTWTDPDHRGKGLAKAALSYVASGAMGNSRTFWYLTEEDNVASVKTAEAVGFKLVGYGRKSPRLGNLFLGYYEIVEDVD